MFIISVLLNYLSIGSAFAHIFFLMDSFYSPLFNNDL